MADDSKVTPFPTPGPRLVVADRAPEPGSNLLPRLISATRTGDKATFRFLHNGSPQTQCLTPGKLESLQNIEMTFSATVPPGQQSSAGLSMACTAIWFEGMIFGKDHPFIVWAGPDLVIKTLCQLGFLEGSHKEITFDA